MQFRVFANDGKDKKALDCKRGAGAHIAGAEKMKGEGEEPFGTPIMDGQERMIGAMMPLTWARNNHEE